MSSEWDYSVYEALINFLRDREHLYNRNHPKYKIYTLVKECTEFGKSLKPPKTSKEILDKITYLRRQFLEAAKILEDPEKRNISPLFHDKCTFMYLPLLGKQYQEVKRKANDESIDDESSSPLSKKPKQEQSDSEFVLSDYSDEHSGDSDYSDTRVYSLHESSSKMKSNKTKPSPTSQSSDVVKKIIDFIKDKPFIYNTNHIGYDDQDLKNRVLSEFGKTLKPPLSANLAQAKIRYIRSKFFSILHKKKNNNSWCWFNDCKFFLKEHEIVKNVTFQPKNKETLFQSSDIVKQIIDYIRDKPYIHNCKHPDYNYNIKRMRMLETFGSSMNPPQSAEFIQNKIRYIRKKYFDTLRNEHKKWCWFEDCKFFKSENTPEALKQTFPDNSLTLKPQGTHPSERSDDSKLQTPNRSHRLSISHVVETQDDSSSQKSLSARTSSKNQTCDNIDSGTNSTDYDLIRFLRDKPFIYNKDHQLYTEYEFKNKLLAEFGKTFQPPLLVNNIKTKIKMLKQNFFKAMEENQQWHWFEQCQFFLDNTNKVSEEVNKLFKQYKFEKYNQDSEKIITITAFTSRDLIKFLKDKPFIYNKEHPLYHDFAFKNKVMEDFGKTFKPVIPLQAIKNKIRNLKDGFTKSMQENRQWRWSDQCLFFLDTNKDISYENNKMYEKFKDEIHLGKKPNDTKGFTKAVIDFIRDKPYFYHHNDTNFYNHGYKLHILEQFGNAFDPPVSALRLKQKISELKKLFYKSNSTWCWYDSCKFFLNFTNDENGPADSEEEYIEDSDLDIMGVIIQFLKDKPYMYDKFHSDFNNKDLKYDECFSFGASFNPPLSADFIARKIIYIRNKIVETQQRLRNKDNNSRIYKWHWYDKCQFLHDFLNADPSVSFWIDLTFQEAIEKNLENSYLMVEIITFIEDNPCLYNVNHADYKNITLKYIMQEEFIKNLNSACSEDYIIKMIESAIKKVRLQNIEDELSNFLNEDDFHPMDNIMVKQEINDISSSQTFVNENGKTLVDFSVQCNLYEELWDEKVNEAEFSDRKCKCVEKFFEIIKSKPVIQHKQVKEEEYYPTESIQDEEVVIPKPLVIKNEQFEVINENDENYEQNLNELSNRSFTKDVIDFIRHKPFFYDRKHKLFYEHAFKDKILEIFGNQYNPPIPLIHLKKKISSLKNEYYISVNKTDSKPWFWREECDFFQNSSNETLPEHLEMFKEFKNKGYCKLLMDQESGIKKKDKIETRTVDKPKDLYDFADNELIVESDEWPTYEESNSSEDETFKKFNETPKQSSTNIYQLPNGIYICKRCNIKFSTIAAIKEHDKMHIDKSLLCSKCGKINKNIKKLGIHERQCDLDKQKYCFECKNIFKTHLYYYDHMNRFHEKAKPYVCVCQHSFTSYDKLIIHMNKYSCGEMSDCLVPNYISKEWLATFIEIKHYDDDDYDSKVFEKTKFWCRICRINHIKNTPYMKHFKGEFHMEAENYWIKKFNIKKVFPCEFCTDGKNVFDNISDLVHHRHSVHHKCTLDDYFEKFEKANTEHVISEITLEEYPNCISPCRICRQEYLLKEFKEHFKSTKHLQMEKNWLKKFKINSFDCKECSSSSIYNMFDNLNDYLCHQFNQHSIWPINRNLKELEGAEIGVAPNIPINFRYYCPLCDEYFKGRKPYYGHLNLHRNEFPYKCSCGKFFRNYVTLVNHARNRCPIEGRIIPKFSNFIAQNNEIEIDDNSLSLVKIEDQSEDQIEYQPEDQVEDQTENQIEDQTEDQIEYQTEDQNEDEMEVQIEVENEYVADYLEEHGEN